MAPRLDRKEQARNSAVEQLQLRIAKLIVENETLQNELSMSKSDSHEIISYLKETVEEKDEEICRLEEMVQLRSQESTTKLAKTNADREDDRKRWEKESLAMMTEMSIIRTQLDSHKRLTNLVTDLQKRSADLELKLKEQDEKLRSSKAHKEMRMFSANRRVNEKVDEVMATELTVVKNQMELQRDAQLKMNEKIIDNHKAENKKMSRIIEELQNTIQELKKDLDDKEHDVSALREENLKLRQLLERANSASDKTLSDWKRRLEDSEKRRLASQAAHGEELDLLTRKLQEAENSMRACNERCNQLEAQFQRERDLRMNTVATHAAQNAKVIELKEFFRACSTEENAEKVFEENRKALFSKLALIVDQIPIVL